MDSPAPSAGCELPRRRALALIGTTVAGLPWLLPACSTSDAAQAARLTVHYGSPQHVISPLLLGSNIQWEHNGDGALAFDSAGKADWFPGLIEAIRAAQVAMLRFPGGDLTNTYRWKTGIGERDARPPGLSYARDKIPSNFGTDEFIQLCRAASLPATISVNVSAGPQEAADWVDYLNGSGTTPWGSRRAANGSPEPLAVRYWEIGNELYNPNQPGHGPAAEYGRQVIAFGKAMKARDPGVRIGAHLEASFLQAPWMPKIYPHMATWNEEVLQVAGRDMDYAVVHFYVPHDTLPNDDALSRLVWAGPLTFVQNLAQIRGLLARYARPDIEIALTEYGTYFGEKIALSARIASTENALFNAMLLFDLARDGAVQFANHWSLINNSRFGMLEASRGQRLVTRPMFEVFQVLAQLTGKRMVPVDYTGPTYSVDAKGNIPATKVPQLDAVAARDESGALVVSVVNRSPRTAQPLQLSIADFPSPLRARTISYYAPDGYAMAWRSAPAANLSAAQDGMVAYTLPPQSLTLVTVTRA
jgi:alpha-N-arabinofuranosidase